MRPGPPRTRREPGGARRERGSASVLVMGLVAAVLLATAATGTLATAVAARRTAAAAADLGALAGAGVVRTDPRRACRQAAEVVRRNGATPVGCRVSGWTVEVVASVPAAPAERWLRLADPTRRARAGPATAGPAP